MTNKQFRHDLRRGLGSCQAAFSDCKDIYIFHNDLLWGCRYALAYDAQSEGTRASYLFEMIKKYDDWSDFLETASEGAVRAIKDDGWRFAHFCDLIALMSSSGYEPAQKTMNVLYERLFNAVRTGRTPRIRMSIPATKKLVSDPRATVALETLVHNYRPGDSETIINCVISSGSFGNNPDKSHRIFDAIYDVIDYDLDACRELSATLLPYMFKETPCSHCRYLFAKKMQELKLLTPQLIKMCRYDCNENIRKLVI